MKTLFFITLFSVSFVNAHIDEGTWKGSVRDGVDCYMDVGAQSFEGGLHHPLAERIEIKIGSTIYSVRHPHSIDSVTGKITFNHDLFEGVVPTKTGAFAVQIKMVHSVDFEGPASFSVMEHNWKTGSVELVHCDNLKKVDAH